MATSLPVGPVETNRLVLFRHYLGVVLRSCRYMAIRNQDLTYFRFVFPAFPAVALALAKVFWPAYVSTLTIADRTTGLLSTLTGFYVAALVALATFKSDYLDVTPALGAQLDGKKLTKRQYLAWLFGYLAFGSFVVYAGSSAAVAIGSKVQHFPYETYIKPAIALVYGFILAHMATLTFAGIAYLVDVAQEPPASDDNGHCSRCCPESNESETHCSCCCSEK